VPINRPPFFPLFVDDFSADDKVEAMDTEEVGAYVLLLCKAWKQTLPGTLPADDRLLSKWARVTSQKWKVIKDSVMSPFILEEGRWHQKRMKDEWARMERRSKLRATAGKLGMQKRWGRVNQLASEGKPAPPLEKENEDLLKEHWPAMLEYFKGECLACGSTENVAPVLILPENGISIENTQPLCRDCEFGMDFDRIDLRINKCDEDMAELWSVSRNGNKKRVVEPKFEITPDWKYSPQRVDWIYRNFFGLTMERVEEIRIEFIAYWTSPEKLGAKKSQKAWDQTFGNRITWLRNKGWLYKKFNSQVSSKQVEEDAKKHVAELRRKQVEENRRGFDDLEL
jgi:uncharacterized protein YdaU (DUF1376 family)